MQFLKSLFGRKDQPIHSYEDFWEWFQQHEKKFYNVLKNHRNIHAAFFDKMSPKLAQLKDGFWFLAGMYNDTTVELILTADGDIKNIAFVEDLVAASPNLERWKFTALKQPSEGNHFGIEMDGYVFNESKMHFYANEHKERPDEIDITITHEDFNEGNQKSIKSGVYLALDNSLGELRFATAIDDVNIIHPDDATEDLIPIAKLRDYLIWREKEFVEKYQGFRHNTENDSYSGLEATLKNGLPLIAFINTDLLNWDSKASHPWMVILTFKYDGTENNGLPNSDMYQLLNAIEDEVMETLKDKDGYLNVGRQTADSERDVYFACMEFRKPSKVLYQIQQKYKDRIEIDYDIYKDKYWLLFDRFQPK